ncbi:hydrogenase nickel incorporation protein HypB [Fusibacter sp. JL216-2]|uniref:hydrogenase nickel incorporation protein HypB n=1 Tax=Fusibacter sp. JL216-2 TaxID=3071453 RepID=UPI003D33B08D
MATVKVIEIKKRIFENNDLQAEILRQQLKEDQTFMMNLMSSPGSGKTTLLLKTVEMLKSQMAMGVIEADIDSAVDAQTISSTGIRVNQLHSGGMCHLDAGMAKIGLDDIGSKDLDFVVIENIGNLICPAGYDLGQSLKAMILSVPEGDDKPLKYPKMFANVDVLLISKIDACSIFHFDFEAVHERVKALNPDIKMFKVSAVTGEGMDDWCQYLKDQVIQWKENGEASNG